MDNYIGTLFADGVVGGTIVKIHKNPTEMEQEIIPDNPNLTKIRKKRKPRLPTTPSDNKVKVYSFSGDIDPFKNALHFMEYYRAFLRYRTQSRVKFDSYPADSVYAPQILDLLSDNKRSTKIFLIAWLSYFCEQKLRGTKASKAKHTSLKAFKDTFEEYNCRHMDV